jgi:hypothetical protein
MGRWTSTLSMPGWRPSMAARRPPASANGHTVLLVHSVREHVSYLCPLPVVFA